MSVHIQTLDKDGKEWQEIFLNINLHFWLRELFFILRHFYIFCFSFQIRYNVFQLSSHHMRACSVMLVFNSFSPMNCSLPGSSVHGIFQARILEWIAHSRGSSWPRDRTRVSCIGRWILYCWATWEAPAISHTKGGLTVTFGDSNGIELCYHLYTHIWP